MRLRFSSCFVLAGCGLAIALTSVPVCADEQSKSLATSAARELPPSASPQPSVTPPVASPRVAPRPFIPSRVSPRPRADTPGATQPRYAPGFFGSGSAQARLNQLPRRVPLQAEPPQPMRGQTKPFETVYREPTVSPYLNLYRNEDDLESAPNYFAFVRPQLEQIEANRAQQREIQQLRGQLQGISSTVAGPQYQPAALPATGTRARYMDTAQFYGGWRR